MEKKPRGKRKHVPMDDEEDDDDDDMPKKPKKKRGRPPASKPTPNPPKLTDQMNKLIETMHSYKDE